MERREFLASSLAAVATGATAGSSLASQQSPTTGAREYYQLRRYELRTGPQKKLTDDFLSKALLPGLNRLGLSPVGVFNITIGIGGPSMYVLIPAADAESLLSCDERLNRDAEYEGAAADFLNAPAKEPAFTRFETSLMVALEGAPKLTLPAASASRSPRVFELRTYESSTDLDHRRKVEQVNKGEVPIFNKAGFWPVFFGDTLIGERMPNLTYMVGYENLAARDKLWGAFMSAPETRALFSDPRYAFEGIVSNVNNQMLTPAPYSQI